MAYVFLALAVLCEVAAALSLKVATGGRHAWFFGVAAGYLAAFVLLSLTLSEGLALGVAYGIWAASGVALIAVLSKVFFGEVFNRTMAFGIGLIVAGVLLVEVGAGH